MDDLNGETLMPTGIVRSFNVKSGFGFIRPASALSGLGLNQ